MSGKNISLIFLAAGIAALAAGLALWMSDVQAAPPSQSVRWTLSGHVYEGEILTTSFPLQGVVVGLYCSSSQYEVGYLLRETTTTDQGTYELNIYDDEICEYYSIVETDPPDYVSSGAATVGGSVITLNWIQYVYQDLVNGYSTTGNNFWDQQHRRRSHDGDHGRRALLRQPLRRPQPLLERFRPLHRYERHPGRPPADLRLPPAVRLPRHRCRDRYPLGDGGSGGDHPSSRHRIRPRGLRDGVEGVPAPGVAKSLIGGGSKEVTLSSVHRKGAGADDRPLHRSGA